MAVPLALIGSLIGAAASSGGSGGDQSTAQGLLGSLGDKLGYQSSSSEIGTNKTLLDTAAEWGKDDPTKPSGAPINLEGLGGVLGSVAGIAAKEMFKSPPAQGFPQMPFPMPQPTSFNPFVSWTPQALPQFPNSRYNLGMGRFQFGRRM
jgi:hypothetical protein